MYEKKPNGLRGRSLLTLHDLTNDEMLALIQYAVALKEIKRKDQTRVNLLQGKNFSLLFEKASTRTRCAAVVAGNDEGGHVDYLSKNDIHLGKKESIADTARVLGRMFDGILFRGYKHETVEMLAHHATTCVWNGLTDSAHPTQALADLMTVYENFGTTEKIKCVYLGDGRNNVANSLMLGCAKAGMTFVNCCPQELCPSKEKIDTAHKIAERNGGRVELSHDPATAVRNANAVYTDVWVSMGEEKETERRLSMLKPYQVNAELIEKTGNRENGQLIFLHCLPAFHNADTELSKDSGALEVTDDVFEAPYSKVFEQAENRMHTIKALMTACTS